MTGKQLKNSILQWAIQGKLVPQDPNDEPASVLLEKIRAEKARLIKEGKIKKNKKESIIYRGEDNSYYEKFADGKEVCIDDEIPFAIPSGWEWCRLGCLCSKFSTGPFGTMVHKSDYTDDGIPLVNPTNIKGQRIVAENICKVAQTKYDELRAYVLSENDIVLARRGDLSKCAIVNEEQIGWLAGTGSFFLHIVGLSLEFFIILYTSPYAQDYLIGDSVGTTMNNLNQGLLSRMLIPVPPLSEQLRIIEHYCFIVPIIERYTMAYSERKALDDVLPIQIKKSVLQEAIQGKLVPQDPNDEPVSVLLQRIKEEKQRLVREGKLKKKDVIDSTIFRGDDNKYFEKKGKEVACIDDEIPFEIPESWQWCRINIICSITNGFTPLRTEDRFWRNGDINWFTVEDIRTQGEYINYTAQKITKEATTPDRIVRPGTTLLCCTASVGQCAFTNIPTTTNQQFNALTIKDDYRSLMTDEYLFLFAKTLKDELHRLSGKTTFEFISVKKVGNILVPIPPFNEQKRIVAIVNKSLASIMSR